MRVINEQKCTVATERSTGLDFRPCTMLWNACLNTSGSQV